MTDHNEPWKPGIWTGAIKDKNDKTVAETIWSETQERIILCVNFCEDVSNEVLSKCKAKQLLRDQCQCQKE